MLIDTHTHLESFDRNGTLAGILDRARGAGLESMVTIGTAADDWNLYRELATRHRGFVHYTVGLHPCSVEAGWQDAVSGMEEYWTAAGAAPAGGRPATGPSASWAGTPKAPVALGECGLDRFHLPKDARKAEELFASQRAAFDAQLRLAGRIGCPVVVHSRGAFRECVEMIDSSGLDWRRVVFHCFSEGEKEIREIIARGGRGSFTGILTYKSAAAVRAAAIAQGLERFMIETDAPYLAPVPHRGEANEPAFVRHTAEYAANEVFRVSFEELAAAATANAKLFYGL